MKKLLLSVIFLVLSAKPVLAANQIPPGHSPQSGVTPFFEATPTQVADKLYNPAESLNLSQWLGTVVNETGILLGKQAIGLPGVPSSVQSSASQFFAGGIDTMIANRPASSVHYIAYLGHQFHLPGTPTAAYAAEGGQGFNALNPILSLWTVSRNIAYLGFALIFVVVGLMIMFRVKIDPKTAATIQNSLPKIIVALILVTFSYAIAGFLIDIMYVILALLQTVIYSVSSGNIDLANLLSGSIFNFVDPRQGSSLWSTAYGAADMIADIVSHIVSQSPDTKNALGNIAGGVAGGLAYVIIAIAILVALFRTWLSLVGAYANIILAIIGAPFMLMLDAVPGQNQFGNWLRNMLSNLLAFPTVVAMLAVGSTITLFMRSNPSDGGFVPPLIGAGDLNSAAALVGLGILLSIPKAVNIVQELLKAPPFKYGNAWMESLGAGYAASSAGTARSYSYSRDTLLGREAAEWQKGMKQFKEGVVETKPSRWSKGGIGDLLGAKQQK